MELSPQIHTEILNLLPLPVTNGNDALLGIVTFDDAEAPTDFHRRGSLSLMSTRLREASIGTSGPSRLTPQSRPIPRSGSPRRIPLRPCP